MACLKKSKKNNRRRSKRYKKDFNFNKKDINPLISNSFSEENNLIKENDFSFEELGFGSNFNDYLFGFPGQNIYEFGSGFDVIDYSYLPVSISLVRGGTVDKGVLGTDTFLDFYDKLIATNNQNDWLDGFSDGGFIADLEVNLSKGTLDINNLPGLGSISSFIEKFENVSGSNNSDKLIGNYSDNTILGNQGNDFISGKRGKDNIIGGDGNDFLKGGRGNDNLFGGSGEDLIEGGSGKDTLNGGKGADTFIYKKVKDSRLINKKNLERIDWIQDFNTNEDKIYFSEAKESQTFIDLGELNYLSEKSINKALKQESSEDFNTLCFKITSSNKTYLAINGSGIGFQRKNDLLIEITGYIGALENFNIINNMEFSNPHLFV